MKLIEPSYEIITQKCDNKDTLLEDMYKHIELCSRICYKSEDKITENSAKEFVQRMIDSKHYAMLEHGTIYLEYHVKDPVEIGLESYHEQQIFFNKLVNKYSSNPYSIVKVNHYYDTCFITTNYRVIVENDWFDDIKLIHKPSIFYAKRYTVKFITDIGVGREFLRHRVFSFANESTRFCNYSKDRFGNEITFIKPLWFNTLNEHNQNEFLYNLDVLESAYLYWIKNSFKPQDARAILPLCTKSELVITGFDKDWIHFFELRALGTTGAPHPEAKRLAEPLMREFINKGYIKELTNN